MQKEVTAIFKFIRNLLFVGTPTAVTYTITLLIEGIVSALIVTFSLMLY
jgi:hypothetical protein